MTEVLAQVCGNCDWWGRTRFPPFPGRTAETAWCGWNKAPIPIGYEWRRTEATDGSACRCWEPDAEAVASRDDQRMVPQSERCQFHGCSDPAKGMKRGWGLCQKHYDEIDYLLHHAESFDLSRVTDFWNRMQGRPVSVFETIAKQIMAEMVSHRYTNTPEVRSRLTWKAREMASKHIAEGGDRTVLVNGQRCDLLTIKVMEGPSSNTVDIGIEQMGE